MNYAAIAFLLFFTLLPNISLAAGGSWDWVFTCGRYGINLPVNLSPKDISISWKNERGSWVSAKGRPVETSVQENGGLTLYALQAMTAIGVESHFVLIKEDKGGITEQKPGEITEYRPGKIIYSLQVRESDGSTNTLPCGPAGTIQIITEP